MFNICKRKRFTNIDGFYHVPVKSKIIILNKEYNSSKLYTYYDKIKSNRKDRTGRYMIKKVSLVHGDGCGLDLFTTSKKYFCYADAGIGFTSDRKDGAIFYSNNYQQTLKLAKLLLYETYNGWNTLISIVDRKDSGKETYIVNKKLKNLNRKIFVK